jgi:L-2-hydroxyglutarate oxidase LhgO
MTDIDCIVIGAGVIGLAVARALDRAGREVIVLERERHFGSQTSSRNSEVIHAGLHYAPGSLKAQTCVEGRELLYDYCASRFIRHRRCGKLIVATSEDEIAHLQQIENMARANGVNDLVWLDAAQAQRLEPELSCVAALCSPSTGIIDSHAYMLSLVAEVESHGASVVFEVGVTSLRPTPSGIEIFTNDDSEAVVRARTVINAAGLQAADIASSIEGFPAEHVPRVQRAKGNYFTLAGRSPFQRLIYPVPEPGGLGIHLTIDMAGQARFGPDVQWIDESGEIDYRVDASRSERFYPAIRRYWPNLKDGHLLPAYSGVRPKLSGPGELNADFSISGPETHGVEGVINLFGIESPGLTASLALAERVTQLLRGRA